MTHSHVVQEITFLCLLHLVAAVITPVTGCHRSGQCVPDFTIVVLPDVQYYNSFFEETFQEQTFWACQCAGPLRTIFVSQLGDLVHRGNKFERDWLNAGYSARNLARCGLPHAFLPGNHDTDSSRPNPYHFYDLTFPLERYASAEWFGGSHHAGVDLHNSYQLFTSPDGAHAFVFLHLEFLPSCNESESIVQWASDVLSRHPDRIGLLSTHYAGTACADFIHTPIKHLMIDHCNLRLVFGGHVTPCGAERAIRRDNRCGGASYALISNYQDRPHGGDGWLRYYSFFPAEETVCAYTYSPPLVRFETDEDSHFSLLNLGGNMSLGPGCAGTDRVHECRSHYASPGFVLASAWLAGANLLLLFLLILLYPEVPSEFVRALEVWRRPYARVPRRKASGATIVTLY